MKYTTPEIEVLTFEMIDVIQTSSEPTTEGPTIGADELPYG